MDRRSDSKHRRWWFLYKKAAQSGRRVARVTQPVTPQMGNPLITLECTFVAFAALLPALLPRTHGGSCALSHPGNNIAYYSASFEQLLVAGWARMGQRQLGSAAHNNLNVTEPDSDLVLVVGSNVRDLERAGVRIGRIYSTTLLCFYDAIPAKAIFQECS